MTMKITDVSFTPTHLCILTDTGYLIGHPIDWYSRLLAATEEQRGAWQINRFGDAERWEAIDEDLSLEGFLDFRAVSLGNSIPNDGEDYSVW